MGWQRQTISQPEAEARASSPTGSSLWACLNDPTNTETGFFNSSVDDCEDKVVDGSTQNQGYNTDIDPATGQAIDAGTP